MTVNLILAHGGLDGIFQMFDVTVGATFIIVAVLLLCVVAWVLRDVFRFGRGGFSWLVAVGVAALFSSVGFWLAGYFGALLGTPVLIAFGFGRFAAHRKRMHHD